MIKKKKDRLRVGRINYLNIWPIFEIIKNEPVIEHIDFISGHPSLLNTGLDQGTIDLSPSSSFEYLAHGEKYRLLPNLGISAGNEIKSVLFCMPFVFDQLEKHVLQGGRVLLSTASAASAALLKVIWHYYWKLPAPVWSQSMPGQSLDSGEPFLEIGDHALNIFVYPRPGFCIIDLAAEWKKFTGLPFVFALWILNREVSPDKYEILKELEICIRKAVDSLPGMVDELAQKYHNRHFRPDMIKDYWQKMDFCLGPEHLAGLALFGRYLTDLKIISGMPVLDFVKDGRA